MASCGLKSFVDSPCGSSCKKVFNPRP